jgi:hypothetical protein
MRRDKRGTSKLWFFVVLVSSVLVGLLALIAPQRRMPVDFHVMLWWSLPLSGIWVATLVACAFRFHWKALWFLVGAPLALYWPIWLMVNRVPPCYWTHNCL